MTIEIKFSESFIQPGAKNVTIFAADQKCVAETIDGLRHRYAGFSFSNPCQINSERWGALGRVWDEISRLH